jgi:antitoxin component YwqK of YwqJK toxin-antitoxin module
MLNGGEMNKKLAIVFISISFILIISCKKHNQSVNYYDLNGKRISEKKFIKNGKNGKVEAVFMGENGKIWKDEVEYIDGKKHGRFIRWNEKGYKFIEGKYEYGMKHGKWIYWHRSGKQIEEYKKGLRHGKDVWYYANGNKYIETNFKNGKKHGKVYWWDEKGNIIKEEIYEKGKLVKNIK